MRQLPNNYRGCKQKDCPKSDQCWRFQGAKARKDIRGAFAWFDPENCEYFLEIPV